MGAATAVAVGGIVASQVAARQARKGQEKANALMQKASGAFGNIPIPTVEEQSIILQNPDLMGQYTPEQIQVMQEMSTSMEGVSADQGAIDAQKSALEGISEVAQGGFTEADKSVAREIDRNVNQQAQARQKAILNAMASRGVLGSGMELAAQLQGEQQSIEQASRAGENLTQQAQARALQALGQQGSLAGQMRQQSFGEQSDIARARDEVNRFNLQNRQRTNEMNVGARNEAQQYNLQQRQALENQRAALANQQQMHNKGLLQQQFQNQIQRAGGQANINMAQSNLAAQTGQANAARDAGIIGGVANIVGGMFSKTNEDKK